MRTKKLGPACWLILALVTLLVVVLRPAETHLRASALLLRFANKAATGPIASYGLHPLDESKELIQAGSTTFPARILSPRGVNNPPALVIVHGVHRLGIDEPRLLNFARAIASSGVLVLCPEIKELADYHIDPRSIDTIGAAAKKLSDRSNGKKVGLMGLSFAGGLSIITATDPRFESRIAFVVAVGAHHDLKRVLQFLVSDETQSPDGTTQSMHAHDYGSLVLVYSNIERFFPASDLPVAKDALRLWLWEQFNDARAMSQSLSPSSKARMDQLFDHRVAELRPELLKQIDSLSPSLKSVSPSGFIPSLSVPLFLLHGHDDSVIPATETLWLSQTTPAKWRRNSLISRAISHVELNGQPGFMDQFALLHFMAQVLFEADST